MAKKQYTYQTRYVAATPRNGRLTDSIEKAASTGGEIVSGGSAAIQYWELATTDADGNALDDNDYYLKPVQGKSVVVPGDMVANATTDEIEGLPVAVDYTTTGLFRAKRDGGLIYEANNGWYVNPDYAGGGGIDEAQLKKYLDSNGYVTNTTLNNKGYLTSIDWSMVSNAVYNNTSGVGSGYYLNGNGELKKIAYSELSGLPDLSQFVTLTTSQTITGSKWFNGTNLLTVGPKTNVHIVFGAGAGNCINGLTSSEAIGNLYFNYVSSTSYTRVDGSNNFVTSGDVVANSTGAAVSGLAVADASTYGLVKYDNSTIKKNSSGQLYCTVSGGSGGSSVSWSGSLTSGTKIGTLTINGTGYTLYAPSSSGGSGGSTVSWSGSLSSGTKIGTLTINGTGYTLYAPSSSGGSGGTASALSTDVILSGRTHFRTSGNTIGIGMSGGNSLFGWNTTSAAVQDMGNLYFNYISNNVCVRVDTNGKIYSNGSQLSSDTRQKTIVGNETDVLDRMQKIPVIRYYRVNSIDKIEETGFGAQSFLGVFDNVTSVNPDTGYYVINSNAILSIAWQGVNELYTKIKEQQTTIDILQAKLDELMKIVTEMKGGE